MKGGGASLFNIPHVHLLNDLLEIDARYIEAISVGDSVPAVVSSLSDVPLLCSEVRSLRLALAIERLARANMKAAARATLSADTEDGDPLWFLWDELGAQDRLDAGTGVVLPW